MKKIVLAAVITALCATSAAAADLPAKTFNKAPMMAPAYNWTGLYVGVNGGYAWKDPSVTITPNDLVAAGTPFPNTSWNNSGGFGGAQIGYNYQFDRRWLVGIEADIDASDIKGQGTTNSSAPVFLQNVTTQKVDWFGTVRGRLGWVPTDRLQIFGTGGLAYGNVKETVTGNNISGTGGTTSNGGFGYTYAATGPCFSGSSSDVRTGWAVGAGLEYAMWQNVTVKAEYMYVDLGKGDNVRVSALAGGTPALASYTAAFSGVSFNVVRAGLNYKF